MNDRGAVVATGPHRIALLADVRFYREGLVRALERCPEIHMVGSAPVNTAGFELLTTTTPEFVLCEIGAARLPETVDSILDALPSAKVVVIAIGDEELNAVACAEAGAAGYVSCEASIEDLIATIECVARGEFPCSARVASLLARRLRSLAVRDTPADATPTLTAREWQIVRLLEDGLSNKEIAGNLGIVVSTVKNHVHHILEKTQASRRTQAAARLRPWNPSQPRQSAS
ncbi:MAG TPA: response regulator transcription factor [Gemmatimonadaceae bacterium]|jgi:DNA-binding NarL/FixJ family response regulator